MHNEPCHHAGSQTSGFLPWRIRKGRPLFPHFYNLLSHFGWAIWAGLTLCGVSVYHSMHHFRDDISHYWCSVGDNLILMGNNVITLLYTDQKRDVTYILPKNLSLKQYLKTLLCVRIAWQTRCKHTLSVFYVPSFMAE